MLRARRIAGLVAGGAAAALILTGCGSGEQKPVAQPAPDRSSGASSAQQTAQQTAQAAGRKTGLQTRSSVPVPAGVRLTRPGTRLRFGAPATVVFQPAGKPGTVLQVRTRSVRRGSLSDFKGFILDDAYKRKAAYYYATVTVRNLGPGDVGGLPVPLWGVDRTNTLLPAVSFTSRFPPCPLRNLPPEFGRGASLTTCLVYLAPNHGRLTALSYRPNQLVDAITWSGAIGAPTRKKR